MQEAKQPLSKESISVCLSMKEYFDLWDSYKVGDQLYYVGLYADCHKPNIDTSKKYTIISTGEDRRIAIECDEIIHSVYRCEMDIKPRGY